MGVTRVSLGVQDLEPAVQEAIGRRQSYEETEECAIKARALGVGSLNLDLIYGLPLQTEESVARTARRALALEADRVAVFGYAHVPWMKKHQQLIDEETLPGPAARFAQQQAIHRVLTEEGGYIAVGLDHYARPGDAMAEAAATRQLHRSFQGYTDDAAPALIGFGASAIGSLPQGYVQNASTALAYSQGDRGGRAGDRARRRAHRRRPAAARADRAADVRPRRRRRRAGCGASGRPRAAGRGARRARAVRGRRARRLGRPRLTVSEKGRPFVRSVAALFDAYLGQADDKPRHSRAV